MHAGLGRGRRLCRARALLSPKAFGFGAKNNSGHGTGGSFALGCKYHIAIGELAVNLSILLSCCLVGTRGCSSQGAEQGWHPQGHPQPCPSWSGHTTTTSFFLIFFSDFFLLPIQANPPGFPYSNLGLKPLLDVPAMVKQTHHLGSPGTRSL